MEIKKEANVIKDAELRQCLETFLGSSSKEVGWKLTFVSIEQIRISSIRTTTNSSTSVAIESFPQELSALTKCCFACRIRLNSFRGWFQSHLGELHFFVYCCDVLNYLWFSITRDLTQKKKTRLYSRSGTLSRIQRMRESFSEAWRIDLAEDIFPPLLLAFSSRDVVCKVKFVTDFLLLLLRVRYLML